MDVGKTAGCGYVSGLHNELKSVSTIVATQLGTFFFLLFFAPVELQKHKQQTEQILSTHSTLQARNASSR